MDNGSTIATGRPTVVVLPFVAGGAEVLVAEGLHHALCGELTRFRSILVIAPASAAAVADRQDHDIADSLGASHVRGRLRKLGERLELSATLSNAESAIQLWSERFEVPETNPRELEEAVVARVAATLNARLE